MLKIETEIRIDASKELVWQLLLDFKKYPNWNPFIKKIEGDLNIGNTLEVELGGMKFKPNVKSYREFIEFSWFGKILIPGIFDGFHFFEIEELNSNSVLFKQSESFKGILVPLMKKKLNNDIKNQFEEMNLALKKLAEKHN